MPGILHVRFSLVPISLDKEVGASFSLRISHGFQGHIMQCVGEISCQEDGKELMTI